MKFIDRVFWIAMTSVLLLQLSAFASGQQQKNQLVDPQNHPQDRNTGDMPVVYEEDLLSSQQNLRKAATSSDMKTFEWSSSTNSDPQSADEKTSSFALKPLTNIEGDTMIAIEETSRQASQVATFELQIETQPGCVASVCAKDTKLLLFQREQCFVEKALSKANQPNGKVLLTLDGRYDDKLPHGKLYVKFAQENVLDSAKACTFDVLAGSRVQWSTKA